MVQGNESTQETHDKMLDEEVRPFAEIKTKVEDVVYTVVRRHFSNK